MEILGLVPARAGSKGITDKSIAPLAGRPLISYTFEAARKSKCLTRIILSTDGAAIAELAKNFGIEVPFLRPAQLAQDQTPMIDVLRHALEALASKDNYRPDYVVLLQPTSPLRRAGHIDEAVRLLEVSKADSVVSVVEVPHAFTPVSVMKLEGGRLLPFAGGGPAPTRRQDKPKLYARNGPAVLVMQRRTIEEKNSLYGEDCRPYLMKPEESVDIDTPGDLAYAEYLLQRRKEAIA